MTKIRGSAMVVILAMERILPEDDMIRAVNVAFYRAFERGDWEAMRELWAVSVPVSCVHPGWQPAVGREAVLASWGAIFEGAMGIRFTLRNVQVFVAGEAAWVLQQEELESVQEGGERVKVVLLATNLFVRESGAWKMAHHHASPALGAALPPSDPRRLFH
ncbi:MAG: nuclear transport factor 2 family protein [Myxococcales bacterium]|nr:nuclear transport factor 2 family protein [Polyangiaceae bacterium]MDW8248437.1 nuclear transport factor 2 family protein [Myxococcales bacterium]